MKTLLIVLVSMFMALASYGQSASYYIAYAKDANCGTTIILENAKRVPTQKVVDFLENYPVLTSIKDFDKSKKYSLINAQLVKGVPEEKGNTTIFYLINGEKYVVKGKKRVGFSSL